MQPPRLGSGCELLEVACMAAMWPGRPRRPHMGGESRNRAPTAWETGPPCRRVGWLAASLQNLKPRAMSAARQLGHPRGFVNFNFKKLNPAACQLPTSQRAGGGPPGLRT